MAVDTNELLHRIGAVLRGISDKMDRLIEIGERPAREIQVHEMLEDSGERQTDHFRGAGKMVAEGPANESPKKWRRLTDEFVQRGDWANAKGNRQDVDPPGGGWIPADPCYFGRRACTINLYFARPVVDKPEHPAGPKPDPGEWGCEPTEKDIGGGVEVIATARWIDGGRDRLTPADEPAKEPEPEYRQPVLPADAGKQCEFSIDGNAWTEAKLRGYAGHLWQSVCSEVVGAKHWVHARIKKES